MTDKAKGEDSVTMPRNDEDVDGIYRYLAWHFKKAGMPSDVFHYLEVWYEDAQRCKVASEVSKKALEQVKTQEAEAKGELKPCNVKACFEYDDFLSNHCKRFPPNKYNDCRLKQAWNTRADSEAVEALENIEMHGNRDIAIGWVCVPVVTWESNMKALQQNGEE